MAEFPPEIIYDILSRMPVKSLARFRCVCKSWLSYINDPYLQTVHVKEEPTPIMFQQFLNVLPNKECEINLLRAIQGTSTVKKDPVLEFPSSNWTPKNLVLGSCNGLALVCYESGPLHGTFLAVINPLNKQRDDLPPVKIRSGPIGSFYDSPEAAGIGFDDSTNTLKTVCVIPTGRLCSWDINMARQQLRTVVHDSGMSSWRQIAQVPAYPIAGAVVFAHGRLHWLATLDWWSIEDGGKIVWFDVKREEFGLIDHPKQKKGYWVNNAGLVDLNSEVGFAFVDIRIELWVLKQKEWVLQCCFDIYPPPYTLEVTGCWNKDGDILLTSYQGSELFVYTLKTGELRKVDRGDPYDADIRMYQSSLFSINTSACSVRN